ncbi:MAG: AbrB/MazE/SpoVT family DNA-binding domain-containing protein [Candidatus Hydrogenedentes bacterium]|nr:AbrB/MazE/SpoVT family DNA-binding domain-containing protein [Candidatus Hydrogenedentota bacterium]
MTKTLTKHGNSLALVIDKPILELLKIDVKTQLEVITDGDVLIIRPERRKKSETRLREALDWVNATYGNALRRLA